MEGLKHYIGVKELDAKPMSLGEYNEYRGWKIPPEEDPKAEGYLVVYKDGYKSWSPKQAFEDAYKVVDNLSLIHNGIVFPSEENTIEVQYDKDYNGAHTYVVRESKGFNNGKAEYVEKKQFIQFVQKNLDGSMTSGLQSEQLALILLDRVHKLNARFPSKQNERMIEGLSIFLEACKDRITDRIDRGVMGDLKK
jgi:hypothetical protein